MAITINSLNSFRIEIVFMAIINYYLIDFSIVYFFNIKKTCKFVILLMYTIQYSTDQLYL